MSKVGDNKVGSKTTGVKLSDIQKNSEITAQSTSLNAFSKFKASTGARFPTVPSPVDLAHSSPDYNITHFRDHESYDEQGGKRVTYFTDKQCSIGTAKFDHRLETDYTFDQWGIDVKVEVSFENTFQSDKSQPNLHIYLKSLVGDINLWARNSEWDSATEPAVNDDFFNIQLIKAIYNLYHENSGLSIETTDPTDRGELFNSLDNGDGSYTFTAGGLAIPTQGSFTQDGSPSPGEVARIELPANGDWYKVQIIQLPFSNQILKYDVDNAEAPRQDRVEYPLHPEDGDSNDIQIALSYIDKIEVKPAVSDNYDYEKLSMERFADAGKKQGYVRKVFEWNQEANFSGGTTKLEINQTGLDYSGDAGYTTACFVLTIPSNDSSTASQWVDDFITTYGYPEVNGFELTNTNHVYSEDRENGTGCVMIFWGHVPDDKLLNDGTKGTFTFGDAYEALPQPLIDVGQDGGGSFWYPINGTTAAADPELRYMYQASLYFMVGVGRSSSDFVHTYYLDEDNHPWNTFDSAYGSQSALNLDVLESCPTEMWKVLSLDEEISKGAYCTIGGGAGETAVDVSTMNRFSWNQIWWNLDDSYYPPTIYASYPPILPAWHHTALSDACDISIQNGIEFNPTHGSSTEIGYENSNPEPEMSFMAVSREDVMEMYDGSYSVTGDNSFGKFWTNWLKPNPGLPISAKNTGGNEYLDSIGIGGATDRTDQEISYDLDNGNISVTNADAKLHFYRDNMFFEVYDYIPNTEDYYKGYFTESPNLKLEITGIPDTYRRNGAIVFIDSDIWGWDIDDPRSLATRTLVRKDGSATITVNDYPILEPGVHYYQIKIANHNPDDLSEVITETIPSGPCTSYTGVSLTSSYYNARIFPDGVEPNHEIPWGACPNPSLFDKSEVYNTPWHGSYLALNPNPMTNHYYRGGSFDDYLSSKSIGCDAYSIFDADYPSRYRTMSIYGNVLNLVSFRWDTSKYRPPNYPITKRTISTRDFSNTSEGEEKEDLMHPFFGLGRGRSANVRPQCIKFTESLQIKNAYNANVTGSTTWAGHNDKLDGSTFSSINGYSIKVPYVFDEPYSDRVKYSSPMSEPRTNLSPGAYHRARAERDIPVSAETEFYAPHGMSMMSLPFFDGYSDSTDFGSGLGRFDGNYTHIDSPDDPDERSFVFEYDELILSYAADGIFRSNYSSKFSGELYLPLEDINSNEVSSYIQSLDDVEATIKGTVTITNNDDPDDFVTYNITSARVIFVSVSNTYVILDVTRTTNYNVLHDQTWNDGENYTFAFNRAEPSIEADGNDDYIDLGFTFRVVCVDHDVADNNCPIYEVYMSSASSIQNFKHGGGHCKTVINELPEVTDYPLKGVEAPLDSRGKRIERLVSRFKPSANRHPDAYTSSDFVDPSEQDWEMFSIMLGLHTEYPRNEILFDRWVADQSDAGNNTLINPILIGLDNDRAIDHYNENNARFVGSFNGDHSEFTVDTGIISKFHGTPTDTDVQLILEDYPDTDPTYSQAYHNSYYHSWTDSDGEPLWENPIEDPADREPQDDLLESNPSSSDPYPTKDPRKYGIVAELVYSDDTDNPANIGIRFRTNDGESKSINFGPELYAQNYHYNLDPAFVNAARGYADITMTPTAVEGATHTPTIIRITIPEQNIVGEGYYSINIPETGYSETYWAETGIYDVATDGHSGNNETIVNDYIIYNPDSITETIQGKTALMQYTDTYPWDNVADNIQQYYTDFKEIHGFKSLGEGYNDIAGSHYGAAQSPSNPSNEWWNFGPVLDDYQDGKAYPGTASVEVDGLQQEVHLTSLGVSTDVTSPLGNPEVMGDSDDITVPPGTTAYYPQNQDKNAGYGLIRIGNKIGASVGLKVVNRFNKKDLTDPTGSWGYDRSHRVGDDPEKNRKLYERVQSLKIYGTQPLPKDEEVNQDFERIRTVDLGSTSSIDLLDEIMFRTKFEGMVTYPKEAEFNLAFIDRTATVSAVNSGNPYYMEHANTNDVLTGQSTTDASIDRDGYVYGVMRHSGDDDTSLNSAWENSIIKLNVGDKLVINRSSATLTQGDVHIDEEFLIRKTNLNSSLGSAAAAKANWQVINSAYTGVQVGDHEYVDDGQEYIWTDLRSIMDSDGIEQLSIYNGNMLRPLDENGDLTDDHGFSTGQPVIVTLTGSFGPFVSGRTYYVQSLSDDYFQLYDTKANAETGGFPGRVQWDQADEDNATGDFTITPDNSLQLIQKVDPDTGTPSFVHGAHSTLEWYTDQAEPGFYAVTLGVDNTTNSVTYPRVFALIDLRSNCFNDDKLIINAPFGHIPLSTDTSTTTDNLNGLHWWAANESTSSGSTFDNVLIALPGISTPDETFSDRDSTPYGYSAMENDKSYVHLKRGDVITFDYKGSTGTVNSDKPYGFQIKYETSNVTTSPHSTLGVGQVSLGVENSIEVGHPDSGTLVWDTTYSPAGLYYLAEIEYLGLGENVPDSGGKSTDHKTYFKIIVSEY